MSLVAAKGNIRKLIAKVVVMSELKENLQTVASAILTAVDSDKVSTETGKGLVAMSTGTFAPTTAPAAVGSFYIDTTNKKAYISVGTSASTDWVEITGSSFNINQGTTPSV